MRSLLKTTAVKTRSWKPVAKGKTFCSPGCGHGCTKHEHRHVTREANQLARMMGPGWKPRVHENMGWHFYVESPCKRMQLSVKDYSRSRHYTVYLNPPVIGHGNFVGQGTSPKAAIKNAVNQAMAKKAVLDALVKGLA